MNPNPIEALAEQFEKFPGIGPRQAKRFVYYLLSRGFNEIDQLSLQIKNIRNSVAQCNLCMRMFSLSLPRLNRDSHNTTNTSENSINHSVTLCSICENKNRDSGILMLVSKESDLEAVEKSRAYKGLYFVLGGTLAVLEKEPEKKIRSLELINRIVNATNIAPANTNLNPVSEVILSLSATTEGENTAEYIRRILKEIMEKRALKFNITTLGRGLSTGSELEYADAETIKSALENKK